MEEQKQMPSTYAHYRFGNEVLQQLPEKQQKIIQSNISIYNVGLHGPDLLFYYHPLTSDPINRIGYHTHELPAISFFKPAGNVLLENNFVPSYAAYVYGYLCHFALDRECHDYIAEKISASGAGHAHIEVSFDRSLLEADGFDPVKKRLTEHINAAQEMSKVISNFYPGVTPKNIHHAIRSMVFYSGLLRAPNKIKRGIICAILKLSGNYREMRGMLMDYEPDPVCADSDKILMQRYKSAIPKAVKLITEFEDSVKGNIPFDPLYRYSFDSTLQDEKK